MRILQRMFTGTATTSTTTEVALTENSKFRAHVSADGRPQFLQRVRVWVDATAFADEVEVLEGWSLEITSESKVVAVIPLAGCAPMRARHEGNGAHTGTETSETGHFCAIGDGQLGGIAVSSRADDLSARLIVNGFGSLAAPSANTSVGVALELVDP